MLISRISNQSHFGLRILFRMSIIRVILGVGFVPRTQINRTQNPPFIVSLWDTMPDLHSLPEGTWPSQAVRNNGSDELALERFKLRELAEGWPLYRYRSPFPHDPHNCLRNPVRLTRKGSLALLKYSDSCEWENFRSIFHEG